MRVQADPDIRGEQDLLSRLRALVRSPLPYALLREAVASNEISSDRYATIRRNERNATRAVALLTREKLLRLSGGRLIPKEKGRKLVDEVRRAAGSPPSAGLVGKRIISVSGNSGTDLDAAERQLLRAGGEVLRSEGEFDLLAVLPDEFDLVGDLTRALRRNRARAAMTRVVRRLPRPKADAG